MFNSEIEAGQAIFWSGEVVPIHGNYIVINEQGHFSDEMVTLGKGERFPDDQGQELCYYFYEPCLKMSRNQTTIRKK
jgi:hypothetical protein